MATVAPAPTRSWLRVGLAVLGAVVSALLIGFGALVLLDTAARHSTKTQLRYADVHSLLVRNRAGDVSLTAGPAGSALTVEEDETRGLFGPKIRTRVTRGGTLTLIASCGDELQCSIHYVISVPPEVAVDVGSGFGDIHATGLTSTSAIRLSTTAGDIVATGLSAPDVRLSTGVGGLTASLERPAHSLEASTVAGSLALRVPDTTYAATVHSSLGHVSDGGLRIDSTAPRAIDAHSSLGNITITPR